ncbi:TIGR04255 family protein [Pseudomonas citrulli]|uniref:TIGR04255 family protein n=1 Tax=Pseudomonas citrulli TaxID=3064347 RepID=UPI003ABEC2B3
MQLLALNARARAYFVGLAAQLLSLQCENMAITFRNAPLIEVIAEIKWGIGSLPPEVLASMSPMGFQTESGDSEAFYSRVSEEVAVRGITRAERLMPPGFPVFPGQVVYRYKSASKLSANLMQVGPGVFTVNALPPYKSWDDFSHFISEGLDALLASRPASERDSDFASVNLRFINGFGKEYYAKQSRIEFLRGMGFEVGLPGAMDQITKDTTDAKFNLNYTSKLPDGAVVQVNLGEGVKDGAPIQVVELGCTHSYIGPDREKLLAVLHDSHSLIESIFLDMTKNIRDQMIPQEV